MDSKKFTQVAIEMFRIRYDFDLGYTKWNSERKREKKRISRFVFNLGGYSAYPFSLSYIPIVAGTIIPRTLYRVPKRSSEILGHSPRTSIRHKLSAFHIWITWYGERTVDCTVSKIAGNKREFLELTRDSINLFSFFAGLFSLCTRNFIRHSVSPPSSYFLCVQGLIKRIRVCSYLRTTVQVHS